MCSTWRGFAKTKFRELTNRVVTKYAKVCVDFMECEGMFVVIIVGI